MSAVGVTCSRTIGHARNLCSSALAVGGFLAASAVLFSFSLDRSEGARLAVPSLWASAVSAVLPLLCAVLAMDSWSEERRTGRVEMLLSLPVRERELVFGKFLGVFLVAFSAVVFSLIANIAVLAFLAPSVLEGVSLPSVLPALAILGMQCALYVSVSSAVSAFITNAVGAVTLSSAFVWALPRGVWYALVSWFPSGSESFGEFPLDAHVVDVSSGVVWLSVIVFYLVFTGVALFIADKAVFSLRFRGGKSVGIRISTSFTMFLATALSVAVLFLAARRDIPFDFSVVDGETRFSPRTRNLLSESQGDIRVTCLVPRSDRRFRAVSHLLRTFADKAQALGGGCRIDVEYVDPRWDIGKATKLAASEGVTAPAVVFANRRRREVVPLTGDWGERSFASAIKRLYARLPHEVVYWTVGHGESSYADYGPAGLSDIARELSRDGYRHSTIDLTGEATIPSDCALIAVAGAKTEFSRAETARLDAFLRQGGRLLLLADGPESALLSSLLPSWGAIAKGVASKPARTLTGTDIVISEFGPHPVSNPLCGSQVVLDRPVLFAPSAAAGVVAGADTIEFSPLVSVDSMAVAAILERGAGAGSDTAIRPTRIAVIGDATVVRNAQLESRANANRDFFLNCVAYLSGGQFFARGGTEGGLLVSGLDRRGRLRFLGVAAGAVPLSVTVMMLLVVWRRRHRK